MHKAIINWREATERVTDAFIEKYFPEQGRDYTFWAADEIGGVFFISDMFFNVDRMIEALELNATFEQLSEYNDAEIEHGYCDPGKKEVREFVAMANDDYNDYNLTRKMHENPVTNGAQSAVAKIVQSHEYQALKAWLAKRSSEKPMPVNFKNFVKYGWIGKEEV